MGWPGQASSETCECRPPVSVSPAIPPRDATPCRAAPRRAHTCLSHPLSLTHARSAALRRPGLYPVGSCPRPSLRPPPPSERRQSTTAARRTQEDESWVRTPPPAPGFRFRPRDLDRVSAAAARCSSSWHRVAPGFVCCARYFRFGPHRPLLGPRGVSARARGGPSTRGGNSIPNPLLPLSSTQRDHRPSIEEQLMRERQLPAI